MAPFGSHAGFETYHFPNLTSPRIEEIKNKIHDMSEGAFQNKTKMVFKTPTSENEAIHEPPLSKEYVKKIKRLLKEKQYAYDTFEEMVKEYE